MERLEKVKEAIRRIFEAECPEDAELLVAGGAVAALSKESNEEAQAFIETLSPKAAFQAGVYMTVWLNTRDGRPILQII